MLVTLAMTGAAVAGNADLHPQREPPRDSEQAKARQAAKLRLIAKLHAEVPKLAERVGSGALDAPIFHRYDRP